MSHFSDIGIDLGNSKFSLCVRGEGIVASEAAYLAFAGGRLTPRSVVAVGDDALAMFERTPAGIKVICPMREGIVVDCGAASLILETLARRGGIRRGWVKPKTIVATLYGSSSVERKAFQDVAASLGSTKSRVVHEPLAAANGLDLDMASPVAQMLVDVGDGATEAIIVSSGQTVVGSSIRFGGHDVDTRLIDHARKRFGMIISRTQARLLKERLATLSATSQGPQSVTVKGINARGYVPFEKIIPLSQFQPVLDGAADVISTFVNDVLALAPPEVSVDLSENGIYLCGGASRMAGVKHRLETSTRLEVKQVDRPEHTVASGLNRMLTYPAYC